MPEPIEERAAYSVSQVAALCGYRKQTIRDAIGSGELRAFMPNGNVRGWRILGAWVVEWLEGGARKPEKPSAPRGDAARAATRGVYQ